jgi:hypothetical protein
MQQPVSELRSVAGLEVRQQVELAAVVATVAWSAERHHTIGVVAAAERARQEVGRVDRPAGAHEAPLAEDLWLAVLAMPG